MAELDKKARKIWRDRRKKIKAWQAAQMGPAADVSASALPRNDGKDEVLG